MNYLLDGLSVLCEFSDSGEVLREYVPQVSVSVGGGVYFYHFDRLGSVRFLSDESGSIVKSMSMMLLVMFCFLQVVCPSRISLVVII